MLMFTETEISIAKIFHIFSLSEPKAHVSFSDCLLSIVCLFLQNHWVNFNQIWQIIFWERGFKSEQSEENRRHKSKRVEKKNH
jgi:hypothetical protein